MSTAVIDEVVEKMNGLSHEERQEVFQKLKPPAQISAKTNGKKGYVSPDTIWMRDHSAPYAGKYVAVENGELFATGRGYPDTLANAKKAGAIRPLRVRRKKRRTDLVWWLVKMPFSLDFEKLLLYNRGEPGISVGVEVRTDDHALSFEAKIDTGSTFCVFERRIGEELGISIESGEPS